MTTIRTTQISTSCRRRLALGTVLDAARQALLGHGVLDSEDLDGTAKNFDTYPPLSAIGGRRHGTSRPECAARRQEPGARLIHRNPA